MYFCATVAIISGLSLLYFYYHNSNRRIERHFFKTNKVCFGILEFVIFVLVVSTVLNIKYIITEYWYIFMKKIFKMDGGSL